MCVVEFCVLELMYCSPWHCVASSYFKLGHTVCVGVYVCGRAWVRHLVLHSCWVTWVEGYSVYEVIGELASYLLHYQLAWSYDALAASIELLAQIIKITGKYTTVHTKYVYLHRPMYFQILDLCSACV